MTEPRQSELFNIVARALACAVLRDVVKDVAYVAGKARHLCYCGSAARRDAAVNSIYAKCESELALNSPEQLRAVLARLRRYAPYVHDTGEFWRLHDSLRRFTHCSSFFAVCMPTVVASMATLLTLVLANQLLLAAEIVEEVEGYLFDGSKPLARELADLLDMKYGLVNLVQYKILPMVLGARDECAGASASAAGLTAEVEQLLELPVRAGAVEEVYRHLLRRGVPAANNYAEYVAGLKISELVERAAPGNCTGMGEEVGSGAGTGVSTGNGADSKAVVSASSQAPVRAPAGALAAALRRVAAAATQEDRQLLESAQRYSRGHVLDGAVTSPLSGEEQNLIPLSMSDIQKFMILDYLYTIRVLANCVKQKNARARCKKGPGVTLTINSPFKMITVPGKEVTRG